MNSTITDNYFPYFYAASDKASINGQNNYLSLAAIDLLSMIVACIISKYYCYKLDAKTFLYIDSGALLSLS